MYASYQRKAEDINVYDLWAQLNRDIGEQNRLYGTNETPRIIV